MANVLTILNTLKIVNAIIEQYDNGLESDG